MPKWTFDLICGQCGHPFRAQRKAVFCSTKCRQEASSQRQHRPRPTPPSDVAAPTSENETPDGLIEFMAPQMIVPSVPHTDIELRATINRSFAESCLPLTGAAAARPRYPFGRKIEKLPTEWAAVDRALAVLAPTLLSAILQFYEKDGPSLTDLFPPHQLEHLDQDLAARLAIPTNT